MKNRKIITILLVILFILPAAYIFLSKPKDIHILDIKMTPTLTVANTEPTDSTNVFPKATEKVYCWFKWKNAKVKSVLNARWLYLTDDIVILNHSFEIPRKESSGGVSLVMPENKPFPAGEYRIELSAGKRLLKTLNFKIE